jgi:U2 small nuclear ribonucleoprotein B''
VSNLPEKLLKEDLRRELYMLFSTHGSVLDIVTLKTAKMRGQAHIVYKDIQTAAQAMRHLEGFEFFGRPLVSPVHAEKYGQQD